MQIVKEEIESVLDEEYKCGPKKCTYIAPRTYYIPDDSLQLEPFPLVGQAKRYDPDKGEYVAANVRRSETSTGIFTLNLPIYVCLTASFVPIQNYLEKKLKGGNFRKKKFTIYLKVMMGNQ